MVFRDLDLFLRDEIWKSLSRYNINNVRIVDSYPDDNISVPSISIDLWKQLDEPLDLSKDINGNYYFYLDVYARLKGERDDIITALTVGLDQTRTLLSSGEPAVITEIKPIKAFRPGQFISTSIFTRDYYYIDFDGYTGYGEIDHHLDYSNNTISIEIDFSCNSFISSGSGGFTTTNYVNDAYDADITFYGPGNYDIAATNIELHVYDEDQTSIIKRAYLTFDTTGILDLDGINDVNLYFYVTSGVYSYRSNIYISDKTSIPITRGHWTSSKNYIGEITCTGEGWYSVAFGSSNLNYLNNEGYSIVSIEPITVGEYTSIAAFECGPNNAYLEAIVGATVVYHSTSLVNKFDENNLEGFKLWIDEIGGLYWTRGFVGSVLTTYVPDAIETGTRYHLSVGSRYGDTIYDVKIFANGELIGERSENWFILPVHSEDPIYVAANMDGDTITGFGDVNLYGLRISQDYFDTEPSKRGEYLDYGGNIDICYISANEGFGQIAYDIEDNHDISLVSGYAWTKYLSDKITGSAKAMNVATFRIKVEVVEQR